MRWKLFLLGVLILCCAKVAAQAPRPSAVVVFWEEAFPVADTAPPSREGFGASPGFHLHLHPATWRSIDAHGDAPARAPFRLRVSRRGVGNDPLFLRAQRQFARARGPAFHSCCLPRGEGLAASPPGGWLLRRNFSLTITRQRREHGTSSFARMNKCPSVCPGSTGFAHLVSPSV